MDLEYELLPERTIREIASRCGRGWRVGGEKVPVAMTYREQISRIENYRLVVEMTFSYLRRGERIEDVRDGLWVHVCTEVGLLLASQDDRGMSGV